jgi:hypothetical protein
MVVSKVSTIGLTVCLLGVFGLECGVLTMSLRFWGLGFKWVGLEFKMVFS